MSAHAAGAASSGLIEHLLSEIRGLRDTVSKLTSAGNLPAQAPASTSSAPAVVVGAGVVGDDTPLFPAASAAAAAEAAAALSSPRRGAGPADHVTLPEKFAAQTRILNALPPGLRPKSVPLYYLPWVVQYARRLAEGHQPFGVDDEGSSADDAAAGVGGGRAAGGDHVLIVKQWSDMFEAALVKHLSEDRFDTVNLQMWAAAQFCTLEFCTACGGICLAKAITIALGVDALDSAAH
jgi:hypothetical protein